MDTNKHIAASGEALARPPKGLRQKLERMLAGVTAILEDGATIPTADGAVPKAEMVQRLTVGVARFEAIDAQLRALQQARQQMLQEAEGLLHDYNLWKDSLGVILGKRSPKLAHFGLKPRQPRQPLSSEQKVARAAKAMATRRLRHTAGKRQKAALRYQGRVDVAARLRPTAAPTVEPVAKPPPNDGFP